MTDRRQRLAELAREAASLLEVVPPQAAPALRLDPDGLAAKEVHVRFNAWEHEHLQKLGRRECASMQRLIRTIVRQRLFEAFGDPARK